MNTKTESNPTESFQSIKLGIDAHAKWYYVGRQVDGATPQVAGTKPEERRRLVSISMILASGWGLDNENISKPPR